LLPVQGAPLRDWVVDPEDLTLLVDDDGNDLNGRLLVATWIGLLRDSPVDCGKTFRQGVKFFNAVVGDMTETIRRFSALADSLMRSVSLEASGTFKKSLHREFAKTPIFREYLYWYRYGDPEAYDYILSFLLYAKKAEWKNPALKDEAIAAWLATEQHLAENDLREHILTDLCEILRRQELAVDLNDLRPKHGPGTVAEPGIKRTFEKNLSIRFSLAVDDLYRKSVELDSPYFSLLFPNEAVWEEGRYSGSHASSQVSVLEMVPKTRFQMRTICKEPATFQWAQQGVMNAIVRGIGRSRLSGYIDIFDQSKNQKSALLGSENCQYSTLDLKGASDCVSAKLVWAVFACVSVIRDMLFATRTKLVRLPDEEGTTLEVAKFAPMGSACCFPIQSIIFFLIAQLAAHLDSQGLDVREYILSGKCAVTGYVLPLDLLSCFYGDDMIVSDELTATVIALLTELGFSVNIQKSFSGNLLFRESCGIYALEGKDVTPILFKIKGLTDNSYESIVARIEHCNALWKKGFMNARNVVLRSIEPRYYAVVDPAESPYANFPWSVHGTEGNPPGRRTKQLETHVLGIRVVRPRVEFEPYPRNEDAPDCIYRETRDTRNDSEARYRYALWLSDPFSTIEKASYASPTEYQHSDLSWKWTPLG